MRRSVVATLPTIPTLRPKLRALQAGALLVAADPFFNDRREALVAVAADEVIE
jgi:hypothetical protein